MHLASSKLNRRVIDAKTKFHEISNFFSLPAALLASSLYSHRVSIEICNFRETRCGGESFKFTLKATTKVFFSRLITSH